MARIIRSSDEGEFLSSLVGLPDRIVGLLAPVIIDDRLSEAIKAGWNDRKTGSGYLLSELFREGSQIGSLGTRIDIGFAVGIYGEDTYNDLKAINKIRNAFAHRLEPKTFSHQSIKPWAMSLTIPDRFPVKPDFEPAKITFADPLKRTILLDVISRSIATDVANDPRQRFIRAAEVLNALLSAEAMPPARKRTPDF